MLKKIGIGLLAFILLVVIGTILFISWAPQFGAPPSGDHLNMISQSPNHQGEIFINQVETPMLEFNLSNTMEVMEDYDNAENLEPEKPIKTRFGNIDKEVTDSTFKVTWYGHSAILLEFEEKRIFLDPMLGDYAAPVPLFGKRFPNSPELDIHKVGKLDAVIFSHDHYDHLDYPTVKAIHENVGHFYVPLGLGSHLIHWGVPAEKITELDWWDEATLDDFKFTAAPARHFSGRSIGDANQTLWASWIIQTPIHKIYFSGDGGYGSHFKEIGEKMGPFDFAMMECGQYNEKWKLIHLMPEQTAQATLDLNAQAMMPIHWGAFSLAPHAWIDPAERVKKAADKLGLKLITPEVGASFNFPETQPQSTWWRTN